MFLYFSFRASLASLACSSLFVFFSSPFLVFFSLLSLFRSARFLLRVVPSFSLSWWQIVADMDMLSKMNPETQMQIMEQMKAAMR